MVIHPNCQTMNHLLFGYSFAKNVWHWILKWCGLLNVQFVSIKECIQYAASRGNCSIKKKKLNVICTKKFGTFGQHVMRKSSAKNMFLLLKWRIQLFYRCSNGASTWLISEKTRQSGVASLFESSTSLLLLFVNIFDCLFFLPELFPQLLAIGFLIIFLYLSFQKNKIAFGFGILLFIGRIVYFGNTIITIIIIQILSKNIRSRV